QRMRRGIVLRDPVARVGPREHGLAGTRRRRTAAAAAPLAGGRLRHGGRGAPEERRQGRPDAEVTRHQHPKFSANCMMRGSPAVRICPNVPLLRDVTGVLKLTWLMTLNTSHRT